MTRIVPRRLAVIADVHGNADALAAVLADIDALGLETILNLGDHVSGPLAAAETAEMLMARPGMLCLRGNHDRWVTERAPEAMGGSDRMAHDQLSPAQRDWLRGLPATAWLGSEVFLCHGTPQSDLAYWMEEVREDGRTGRRRLAEIEAEAGGLGFPLLLCAHSHTPRALRLSEGRLLVNPGSVGCPGYVDDDPPHVMQSGLPDACYAVLEQAGQGWRVSFRHVPYDRSRMVALALAAGRAEWAAALETGCIDPAG
ncbi:metallophosphoesterase family protein [Teichococcus cervicalis]|uniref:Ser/Thr phosphatase family protein n=1 Tax=Pseudoroseomonas cervicalis ATCC 49957 TaxID=525371 RepID=D5RHP4_9PROT|nr:metallophosphoesterase family protein [Pseudoroseomonas cervicalis]EFH13177.1 Ser/Thr phosphatase family protein [Pseudoroseomonas cervicalis ATCC 49957]